MSEALRMRMRYCFAVSVLTVLICGGCASTSVDIPITGRTVKSAEVFTGSFHGSRRLGGNLTLSGPGGVKCTGEYSSVNSVTGGSRGFGTLELTCTDGRSAKMLFHENEEHKLFGVGALGDDSLVIQE
jgi:hypothetical protein